MQLQASFFPNTDANSAVQKLDIPEFSRIDECNLDAGEWRLHLSYVPSTLRRPCDAKELFAGGLGPKTFCIKAWDREMLTHDMSSR